MVHKRLVLHAAVCAVAFLLMTTSAWGDIIPVSVTGSVWRVTGNWLDAPTTAPAGTPDVTFTSTGVDFIATGTQTLADFLSSGGATGVTASPILGQMLSDCSNGGYGSYPGCYSTVVRITGHWTFLAGQTYTVNHDDGVYMTVGGNPVITSVAPTVDIPSSFVGTGASNSAFQILYMGTNMNPEVLQLSGPVPEPTSILLLGVFGVALGLFRRKFAA